VSISEKLVSGCNRDTTSFIMLVCQPKKHIRVDQNFHLFGSQFIPVGIKVLAPQRFLGNRA
jgi:hypothetical protein